MQALSGKIERNEWFDNLLNQLIEEAREHGDLTQERARDLIDRILPGKVARDFLAYQLLFWVD